VQSYQPHVDLTAYETNAKQKRLFGVLLALALLGAFVLVFVYYRWFGNIQPGGPNEVGVSTSDTTAKKPGHGSPATSRRTASNHRADAVVPPESEAQSTLVPGITQSTIRSPLAVEVISSDGQHQMIRTRNDSIYLDSHDKTLAAPDVVDANPGGEIKAAEQTRLSSGLVELASPPVRSADPLLAKQQTMEGSVVLLAGIDKDGNIRTLQVISGPEVFFAAAREAVKQWRFKPYYQSGQAVETEAQITVKFAISAH
jgi:TonB family protein